MGRTREFLGRYRIVALAIAASAALHAAVLRGIPERIEAIPLAPLALLLAPPAPIDT